MAKSDDDIICTRRHKINCILFAFATAIASVVILFGYLFSEFSGTSYDDVSAMLAKQLEDKDHWEFPFALDSDSVPDDKEEPSEPVPKSLTYPLKTHFKSSLFSNVSQHGPSLQEFNANLQNDQSSLYLYDSRELLDTEDDYPWGHIYKSRVWCSVLTMWPERRQNIEAVIETWAPLCDRIVFVVDNSTIKPPKAPPKNETEEKRKKRLKKQKRYKKIDYEWEEAPDSHLGFDFLKLPMDEPQSEDWRNIWEKSWKTWHHVGTHHIEEAEWFLKIDDDTFFSPINFKGFARYFNPNKKWYFGNTLLHLWEKRNIVFNSGSCYAISRGALRKMVEVFNSDSFQNPSDLRKEKGEKCKCYCMHRKGAFEDPSMGICLHSVGIDPTNTLDRHFRERFSPFRAKYHKKLKYKKDFWYFRMKPKELGILEQCCAEHPISFHFYKHQHSSDFKALHETYNIEEGVDGKRFEIPQYPKPFLHQEVNFTTDEWRNSMKSKAYGQLVYKGPGHERECYECDKMKDIKSKPG